jgi:hypothetical protein
LRGIPNSFGCKNQVIGKLENQKNQRSKKKEIQGEGFRAGITTISSLFLLFLLLFIIQKVNIYTYFITTEDTESTEGLCPYFLYSVFSGLSVVKLSLEIGEGIRGIDYN